MDYDALIQELENDVTAYGIELSKKQEDKLIRHLMLVIEKNEELNLTSITDPFEAVSLHVVDSLLMLDQVAAAPVGRFLDIGTGAGYPGIPLAIVSGRKGVLLDSVGKKVRAVEEFSQKLGLRTRVTLRQGRAEVFDNSERSTYSVVVARAVSQISTLLEYAAPYLRQGGRLVVTKAHPTDHELNVASRAADLCGFRPSAFSSYELPHELGHREIYSYELVDFPKINLPRAIGMAQHRPLGE